MTKDKVKKLLDFIPLVILTVSAIYFVWIRITESILLTWRHWLALSLLLINYYLFRRYHQLGVLALGLSLVIGLTGVTQYSPGTSISSLYWTLFDVKIPIFFGQPIFLLWLIIHFVVSGRYYFAIATRGYWRKLFIDLKVSKQEPVQPT